MTKDALAAKHGEYDIVLANPPFGKKSSVTIVNEAGETSKESLIINRDDLPSPALRVSHLIHYLRCRAGSLGEHEQVRAARALQLIPRLRDQHIFTILKQHGGTGRREAVTDAKQRPGFQ